MRFACLVLAGFLGLVSPAGAAIREFTYLGNQKLKHRMDAGGPVATENADIRIEDPGHVADLESGKGMTVVATYGFKAKRRLTIQRVRVEDVTGPSSKLLVEDLAPVLSANGQWKGHAPGAPIDARNPPWMHARGDTWRVLRFAITTAEKGEIVLLQPSRISSQVKTQFLRMAAQARPRAPDLRMERLSRAVQAALGGNSEFLMMIVAEPPDRKMAQMLASGLAQAKKDRIALALASADAEWAATVLTEALKKAGKGQHAGVTLAVVVPNADAERLQALAQPSGLSLKVGPLGE
ncbi:MAG TPA: hypothetical protein VEB66_12750 [Opitutaceae bacterium]|nr:hypothetical protein [Opitutaceae bacterium]